VTETSHDEILRMIVSGSAEDRTSPDRPSMRVAAG
jgi:hypothetical protein